MYENGNQSTKIIKSRKTIKDPESEINQDLVYEKARRSDFKQQRLPAWRPVPTIGSVITVLLIFGIIFLALGIILLVFSSKIKNVRVRYDDLCTLYDHNCLLTINIEDDMDKPVMIYYQLDGFYQNSRRYLRSKNKDQLRGKKVDNEDLEDDCEPVEKNKDLEFANIAADGSTVLDQNDYARPCGLIAKTFFNDTYKFQRKSENSSDSRNITVSEKDIAFAKDKDLHDKNYDLSKQWIDLTDEHFLVWIRPSGLPNPKKLWGRIEEDLKKGDTLMVTVNNQYDVSKYKGEKHLVLSTANAFGGKNKFMGVCYLIAGGISMIFSIIFAIGFCVNSKEHNL